MADAIQSLGRLLGLNNRREKTKLMRPLDGGERGTYLSAADNIDISEASNAHRRAGLQKVIAGNVHSLWADERGAYAVIDGTLSALSASLDATPIRPGLPAARLSYSRGPDGVLVWSNGALLRKVVQGVDTPMTAARPLTPTLVVSAGALPAGRYLVALVGAGPAGESAPCQAAVVTVSQGSAIEVQFPSAAGHEIHVYMSGANGDVLSYVGASTSGALTVASYAGNGRALATEHLLDMPAGQAVAHVGARLAVAAHNIVWLSKPWRYGLTDRASGYVPLPERVTILAPVPTGLFICADRTYFLPLDGAQLREVLPFGGVEGTAGRIPEDGRAFWHSPRGLVIAAPDSSASAVQNDVLTFPAAQSGASLWRERDGSRHILASTAGREVSAATASISFEVRD